MKTDYPAAHFMAPTWFAVDRDGHVGAFHSNLEGAVPLVTPEVDIYELIAPLRGTSAVAKLNFNDFYEEAAWLGIFCYYHNHFWDLDLHGDYSLVLRPETPLHVERLPPKFRNLAKQHRLGRVSFPDAARLQPLEHFACRIPEDQPDVAYIASDGFTVRPIPGRESDFAAFCEELRGGLPNEAARLRFEAAPAREGPPLIGPGV
jgi:hypothetical protein